MPRRFKSSGVGANNVEFSYEIDGSIAFNANDIVSYRNAISGFSITNSGSTSTFFSTDIPANLDIQFDENNKSLILKMSSISFGNRGTITEAIFKHNLEFISDIDFQALKNSVSSNNLEDIINRLAISSGLSDNGSYITYDLTMENFLNQNFPDLIDNFDDNGDGLENTTGRHNDWSGQFISVFPGVEIPIGNNDIFNVNENSILNIALPTGVLSNDTDVDNANLTAVIATQPSNGNVTLNDNGSFTYTPNPNFSGQDTFTYKARKTVDFDPRPNDERIGNVDSQIATVTITVNAVKIPVANNDSFTVNQDSVLNITLPTGVLNNDTGIDSANLTAVIETQPSNGNVTLNGNGSFTYTPNPNFSGQDTFTYKARKTADANVVSNSATVTITVNAVTPPPINVEIPIANNDSFTVNQDSFLNIGLPGVLSNDTDLDNANLTAVIATQPSNGNVALNGNGSFTYTPNPNFSGQDTFTYKARKTADANVDSNIATVIIKVNAVDTPPINNDNLNDPIYRFQNSDRSGTYLFAGQQESQGIRQNFPQFREEGFAFNVSSEPNDQLIVFNRFQNTAIPGTYLYAGQEESQNIRQNFPNFREEGVAFYAYDGNANKGVDFYRFQNTQQPGTYLFVGEEERRNIIANFPQFVEEGVAFEVGA